VKRAASGVQFVEEQLAALTDQFREDFREMKRAELNEKLHAKEVEVEALQAQRDVLAQETAAKRVEAQSLGGSSVDLEMMRAEIENLNLVHANIEEEVERVKVERNKAPRVSLIQSAEPPTTPVNFVPRLALATLGLVLGLCLPAGLVLFWDVRKRLVNSSEEVSQLVGLPVMGTLPLIPLRRRLSASTEEGSGWKAQVTESVDGIAAKLLRQAALDDCRVVLVTSAVGGEGKTSLATQLAASLAHRGRKTVLVDGSLRRPAIDGLFKLKRGPGVAEFLRGEGELTVRATSIGNLSVVTAGQWDRKAVTALAGDSAARMFARLREDYDFVVVDSSPVLPLADTRFVAQHADLALLCAMRDVSRITEVTEAYFVLAAMGVENVETAVVVPAEAGRSGRVEQPEQIQAPAAASDS
jgi:polysaccharide biosynthesis transport protein